MPLKTQEVEEPALNLTPMIDIVLLLVIFFMVGTQFTEHENKFEILLPTVSDAQPLTALPDELIVNVANDGSIFLGGEAKTVEELEKDLRAARERYPEQTVIIRGDGPGPYQHVMTVLNICNRAKIKSIQLANQIKEG
ncbi:MULTISPECIES: ExbD/TolR family protein [Thalassoglobus]|uniref:Biopolymer transport protein ExbD n=1 Tax=Thalassoglobus polymorphus TaxID=2527994 RepID=A0A517QJ62_9PLAN|nr:biopolymer transporter ExbD [Thalassoglobus polymorphus]QDT31625.1 Biopolymer transport protein ExbD [Thalassoglobus polymorphus]